MKKKILLFANSKKELSGGQVMIHNILKNIDKEKFRVELMMQEECPLSVKAKKEGISVHYFPQPKIKITTKKNGIFPLLQIIQKATLVFLYIFYSMKVSFFLSKQKYDSIWCENLRVALLVFFMRYTKTRIIYNMWSNVNSKIGLKIIAFIADQIIVETFYQKQFFKHLKLKNEVIVIYTQIDQSVFPKKVIHKNEAKDKMRMPKSYKIVGFLGGSRYSKGYDLLISAAYNLVKTEKITDFLFYVAGTQETDDLVHSNKLNIKIEEIKSNVIIESWISDKQAFYQGIDVFVSTSRSEGLPGTVREAMGYELPIIATNAGGTSEALGDSGFLITEENEDKKIEQLVFFLKEILNKEDAAEALGKKAKQRALRYFIGNKWVKDLEAVFEMK